MPSEFQVVLMAGGHGNRMTTLTQKTPKALLPVCNVPIIIYSLKLLERFQFSEVLLITRSSAAKALGQLLEEYSIQLKVHVTEIPDESDLGTADSLRLVKDKITTDFIVLSADLITDIELHRLIDVHRKHDATVTCLLAATKEKSDAELILEQNAKSKGVERGMIDYIGIEQDTSRVILFENEDDLMEGDSFTFRKSVMVAHPRVRVHRDILDAHLYVFAKWVIDFVTVEKSISTIKGELIPFLVRKQFSFLNTPGRSQQLRKIVEENYGPLAEKSGQFGGNPLKCFAYVLPPDDGEKNLCVRANTTQIYCEANRRISTCYAQLLLKDPKDMPMLHPTIELAGKGLKEAGKEAKKQFGGESMLGRDCKIGVKCSIKRSIIGKHCTIGDKTNISDSIIMDHVTIADGCVIKNSVVCNNAHVGANCSMDRARVGASYTVPEGTTCKNQPLALGENLEQV